MTSRSSSAHAKSFLTRSLKLNGGPDSRLAFRAAARGGCRRAPLERGSGPRRTLPPAWRAASDAPKSAPQPVARPEPRPPRATRPQSLSVTEIEHWLRDPYTIYAKHILKLPRLDPVDQRPGAAERGSVIHAAIGDFAKTYTDALPDDPAAELLRLGRLRFAALDEFPEAQAFWWPRFERIARWFGDFEKGRRPSVRQRLIAEIWGALDIATPGRGTFRLTGRADRIERRADGTYTIVDFKTGAPPSAKQVRIGLAPQLTLEAAMLRQAGFAGIEPGPVAELVYVRLPAGGEPPGKECILDLKGISAGRGLPLRRWPSNHDARSALR